MAVLCLMLMSPSHWHWRPGGDPALAWSVVTRSSGGERPESSKWSHVFWCAALYFLRTIRNSILLYVRKLTAEPRWFHSLNLNQINEQKSADPIRSQFPLFQLTQTLRVPLGMQPSASNSIFSPRPTMQSNTDNIGHLTMAICCHPTRTVFVFFPRPDTVLRDTIVW